MPKKTKLIQKAPKEEKKSIPAQTQEKASEVGNNWDIFTDGFKKRLTQYSELSQEIFDLQSKAEGSKSIGQIVQRKQFVAKKVEQATAAILKEELKTLEEWVGDQQKKLKEDISKIEDAYNASLNSLLLTNAFDEAELKDQLSTIQSKADERKKFYASYDALLARSKEIYS